MKINLLLASFLCAAAIGSAQEKVDSEAIEKIKNEGFNNSHVEEIAFNLIDKSGPRLSNSNGYKRAANYAKEQLTDWGLVNSHLEPWGEFGKGWEVNKSYLAMTQPYYMPFIAVPKAWTTGTNGELSGKVVFVDISSEEDFSKYKGQLKGAIVAMVPSGDQGPTFKPDAVRFTEEELKELEAPVVQNGNDEDMAERRKRWMAMRELNQKIGTFFVEEGVGLILKGARGIEGTLFTSGGRGYLKDAPASVSEIEVAPEHLNLLARLNANGVPVEVEAEIKTTFDESDLQGYNVIAEIPGSDKKLKSELVMLGGHLDSWHGATGATDNAAGCTVMMEAIRILKASGLTPKRTIRIALWGGEEQGLHGSRNYVKNHFGDAETMELTKEHDKVSAYYNIDNGTGRIRGIYMQGNEGVKPIFEEWFKPFDSIIDNTTLTIRNTGGTDHLGFDAIGIPGFQFIQDPIEYSTRTHHTNMDTYERLVIDDLKQMAVIVAAFVYNTAQRDEKLPREVLEAESK
ncbi:M20/M25/M40 family metallo-hydrolase [Allomuricauda sp. NBRC 101325]|uniref:M20/M25/M40 family metallo-hydrolase n=1 Tax=Allomuricauda sp. NBRC 101325 TaxID=1113758 RepID=UPI0024A23EFE|nr:M20/M25/M40 family metallo-hydrolase [Muricauda sp. NBRC 101325]GLU43938.1 aminopeptidase [Muricauda sp. NBRC 101325]